MRTVEIGYTVTNLGAGETLVDTWTDAVWLTRDKNRPHPGQGDLLLKTLTHTRLAGRQCRLRSTVDRASCPPRLESGT